MFDIATSFFMASFMSMPFGLMNVGKPSKPCAPKVYSLEPANPAIAPPIPAPVKQVTKIHLRGIKTPYNAGSLTPKKEETAAAVETARVSLFLVRIAIPIVAPRIAGAPEKISGLIISYPYCATLIAKKGITAQCKPNITKMDQKAPKRNPAIPVFKLISQETVPLSIFCRTIEMGPIIIKLATPVTISVKKGTKTIFNTSGKKKKKNL